MNKLLILLQISILVVLSNGQYNSFRGVQGDYCRKRGGGDHCCDGRIDECSLPLFGTRCYCDQFCDRTKNPDCCPDYWEVCLGISRPDPLYQIPVKHCSDSYGNEIKSGNNYMINCNKCQCNNGTSTCDSDRCLVEQVILQELEEENGGLGWTFTNYSNFWGHKLKEGMKKLTGTLIPGEKSLRMHPIKLHYDIEQIPKHFDARQKWRALRRPVRDQGWCGASWAFSTLSVTEDRLIVASDGLESVTLSPEQLLSCNQRGQQACKGGHVERAWNYLRRRGVTLDSCYPYASGKTGKSKHCMVPKVTKLLTDTCASEDLPVYGRESLYTTEPAYRIASNQFDIMWEIMTNGPVQALMRVYQDFFLYSSGVYSRRGLNHNAFFQIHSVKVLGWGEETTQYGTEHYWLAQNSWGENWGEDGFFRIRRGTNESDIEQFVLAVRTHLNEDENEMYSRRHRRF